MPRDSSTTLRCARCDVSAVLLAGGESLRMGKDKAAILFRGKALWQHQIEVLRKVAPAEILLSARTNPVWRPADIGFVADEPPSRGPLSGLAASLESIRGTHLLALAIDMPFMTESYLAFLCDQITAGQGIVPKIGTRFEPLTAIYPREAAVELRNGLAGTDFSLQRVVRSLIDAGKLREISVTEQEQKFFLNVNNRLDFDYM